MADRPSGFCHNGHNQYKAGFIDSGGDWRCRECRHIADHERDFWKLVNRVMDDPLDQDALDRLRQFHWREP